ncbi:MAG: hypothetical protein E7625_00745 [Ruminococcaceae bacterium]|nr:hypothetical protein [Oscillospiraceae bacterium]
MKDTQRINEAFSDVDDKYVTAAMTPPRRLGKWARIALVAACIALLIGAYFPIRNATFVLPYMGGATFVNTEQKKPSFSLGAQKPAEISLPWDDALYLKGEVDTKRYKPGEAIELSFEIGLKNDYPGDGALRLTLKAPDFDIAVKGYACENGVVTIDDATPERYSVERPLALKVILTPTYAEDYAMGTISLSVGFVPDDMKALMDKIAASHVPNANETWQTAFFDGGALRLGRAELDYAADTVELRLDTSPRGAVDIWEIMLAEHYKMRKISGREFADMYFDYSYRNSIYASVDSYMTVEKTVRFSYMSQNIRYANKEYVDAPEIWERYEKVRAFEMGDWEDYDSAEANAARRELAGYILLYMKEQGIITAEEYEAETAHMANTKNVGNWGVGFDQNVARYSRVLQKYMYTH